MLAAWLLGCREAVRWVSRLEGNKAAAVWQCVCERERERQMLKGRPAHAQYTLEKKSFLPAFSIYLDHFLLLFSTIILLPIFSTS